MCFKSLWLQTRWSQRISIPNHLPSANWGTMDTVHTPNSWRGGHSGAGLRRRALICGKMLCGHLPTLSPNRSSSPSLLMRVLMLLGSALVTCKYLYFGTTSVFERLLPFQINLFLLQIFPLIPYRNTGFTWENQLKYCIKMMQHHPRAIHMNQTTSKPNYYSDIHRIPYTSIKRWIHGDHGVLFRPRITYQVAWTVCLLENGTTTRLRAFRISVGFG
jgi:hypothetical protein